MKQMCWFLPQRIAAGTNKGPYEALLRQQALSLESQNPATFTIEFIGKAQKTLPWIFAANKSLRINAFSSPVIRFQRIFNSMDTHYQNQFMMSIPNDKDEENLIWESLKTWILKTYPPLITKYEFVQKLKSMVMR